MDTKSAFKASQKNAMVDCVKGSSQIQKYQNRLQLNDNETEIRLRGSAPGIDPLSSIRVDQSDISFSSVARNLGVFLTVCSH